MTALRLGARTLLLSSLLAGAAHADSPPKVVSLIFDGLGNPVPGNSDLEAAGLAVGDTIAVTVNPNTVFDVSQLADGDLAFGQQVVPPELTSFFLGFQGGDTLRMIPNNTNCAAGTNAASCFVAGAPILSCARDHRFDKPGPPASPTFLFRCDAPAHQTLATLIATYPKWALVETMPLPTNVCTPGAPVPVPAPALPIDCIKQTFNLKADQEIDSVTATISPSTAAAQDFKAIKVAGNWQTQIPLKDAGVSSLVVTIARKQPAAPGTSPTVSPVALLPFHVAAADTHSNVRVQGELIDTDRGRSVSFAVAVTAVSDAYFSKGPWHCFLLCTVSPVLVLRLSGQDNSTIVQLGLGIGVFVVKALQINAGFLGGTKDLQTGWKWEQNWFVGVAIDPFLIAEIIATKFGAK